MNTYPLEPLGYTSGIAVAIVRIESKTTQSSLMVTLVFPVFTTMLI